MTPFGMKNTPFDPMTGKFLALDAEKGSDLKDIAGYDSGEVQHLTNVNGVIQWVTTEECS